MSFQPGNMRNKIIARNDNNFSLAGMINPTFQNQGTNYVVIDGRTVLPGESFTVNAPNVVLQNSIAIKFESDMAKTNILYVGYVELIQQ